MPLVITPEITLPDDVLEEWFVRSSGPGGQNVNKVSTAVELRLDVSRAPLRESVRQRLRAIAGTRMTAADTLVVESREHRTQGQNREAVRERLAELVRLALVVPKARRSTSPTATARKRRVEAKVRRGRLKARRAGRDDD
jgi:ribosome-associated protein